MKKGLSIISIVLAVAFSSCSKEANSKLSKSIVGQWKFLYSLGGFSGHDTIMPPPASMQILYINSDQTYKTTTNGQVVTQGTYDIITVPNEFSDSPQPMIKFDNLTSSNGLIIYLSEPNLVLGENHLEPYGYIYVRVH